MVARPALTRPALALSIRSAPRLLSLASSRARQSCPQCRRWYSLTPAQEAASSSNSTTIQSEAPRKPLPRLPFRFETGVGLYAKRAPRPFPPPFTSPPSGSFSDALSTHNKNAFVDGELIKGETNGDDAIYKSDYFICANDGVGAWAARPRGHAGLWSRLVLHFWSTAVEENMRAVMSGTNGKEPDPIATLQTAYDKTVAATGAHDWHGTTTACGAQLHYKKDNGSQSPVLYVTNLGDCKVLVIRPSEQSVIYRTTEQWHWFDCPRQMGTNSPDQPNTNAVMDKVDLQVGDVVLAMSDGVIDNLWEHEIMDITVQSIKAWEAQDNGTASRRGGRNGGMQVAANELMAAAQEIALDPFAASPYMEHAIEEGLASEGGKLDDISVVAALCVENSS